MSRFDKEFLPIDLNSQEKFPITYQHIYHFTKKKIKKDVAFMGVRVEAFNTSSFYTSGHHKPISKIVDIDIFKI